MTLNLGIPRLRNQARHESDKAGKLANDAAEQTRRALNDAGDRLGAVDLPGIDVRGAIDSARRMIGDARKTLAEGSDQVAFGAQQVGKQAGKATRDIRDRYDDLRSLELRRKRRDPWPGVALIVGAAGGVAAMFLFDPEDGARRRALLRDKLGKWGRIASERARGQAEHMRNVSKGIVHDVRTAIPVGADQGGEQGGSQTEWPAQEPGGAAAGLETRSQGFGTSPTYGEAPTYGDTPTYGESPTYGELTREPSAPNGRES